MRNKRNKSLFWYGFWARVKIFIGFMLGVMSFVNFFIFFVEDNGKYLGISLILGVIGGIFYFKGKSQRFDYKMQSGTIIHAGDW